MSGVAWKHGIQSVLERLFTGALSGLVGFHFSCHFLNC